jgi:hypothetical protein
VITGKKINKEYGSDFHYFEMENSGSPVSHFCDPGYVLFFSGRAALYNLLKFGIDKHQWELVSFPDYYCHEVVDFCKSLPIEVTYYAYNPLYPDALPSWDDNPKHVFVNVDFFGLGSMNTGFIKRSYIIEDLTHNLGGVASSKAHYCFGSLRKQLPVAVGGFCFGNANIGAALDENAIANHVALQKLTAMFLKTEYLYGRLESKDLYRKLYVEGEEEFSSAETNSRLPEIIKAQLMALAAGDLINRTYANLQYVLNKLQFKMGVRLFSGILKNALYLPLICDNPSFREQLRIYLIQKQIYPAVLWPHQFTTLNIDVQQRVLFVHVDFRYSEDELDYIIQTLNNFNAEE